MPRLHFDFALLLTTYEATCAVRGVDPGPQLDEIGVGRASLTRLRQGHALNTNNMSRMLHWMGDTDIGDYLLLCEEEGEEE
jgi:hypothetical protein